MEKDKESNVAQITSSILDFLFKVLNHLLVPAAAGVAVAGVAVTGAVVFIDSPVRDMAINKIADAVKDKIKANDSKDKNAKINQQFEELKRILGDMNTGSKEGLKRVKNQVDELKGQIQKLGPLDSSKAVEKEMVEAIKNLTTQGQTINKKLMDFLSTPLPVKVSVKSDLEKILSRLENKVEESTTASKKAIEDHGARITRLESVYEKHYERKVELGKRHLGKKVKHFFVGIKE